MKRKFLFPALAFAGGGFTYILRLMQNLTGFEADTGLPVAGNLWSMLLPAALALVLAAALLLAHRAPVCKWAPSGFEASFSSSSTGWTVSDVRYAYMIDFINGHGDGDGPYNSSGTISDKPLDFLDYKNTTVDGGKLALAGWAIAEGGSEK